MSNSPNATVAATYEQIVEGFFEEGLSVTALNGKFGKSTSSINKYLAIYQKRYEAETGHRRERKVLPVDPRSFDGKKALSWRHATIALQIARYRQERGLNPTAFGAIIGQSRVTVRLMELGAWDFSLNNIEKLSEVLKVPFDALVQPQKKAA